jgi:hypothetical protein
MDAIVPIWREELMHVRVTGGMASSSEVPVSGGCRVSEPI